MTLPRRAAYSNPAAVDGLTDAVALLTNESPKDRRHVYEAARLEILYDHENNQAQLSVAPRVTGGVGGPTQTLGPWVPWMTAYADAARWNSPGLLGRSGEKSVSVVNASWHIPLQGFHVLGVCVAPPT